MIYFIQSGDDGPIKIGHTSDVKRRLCKMQSDNPYTLRLLATLDAGREIEADLHWSFEPLLFRGEWYRPEKELMQYIDNLQAAALAHRAPDPAPIIKPTPKAIGQPEQTSTAFNATQVAQHLKVSGSRVRALIAAGRLLAEKVGRDWVIQQSDLDTFVPRKAGRPRTIKAETAGHEAHSADGGKE